MRNDSLDRFGTRLEKRFCTNDYTVMDPVLYYFDIETSHQNRVKYSIYSALTCFLGCYLIYLFRFKYKTNIE